MEKEEYPRLALTDNAMTLLKIRYLRKNENGEVVETPEQMFRRICHAVASVERNYGKSDTEVEKIEEEFFDMLTRLYFLPNSPTIMNAGTGMGQLSACNVLPLEDSMESIFDTIKNAALTQKSGGGTGFSFSNLRPKGDVVKSTGGIAAGPIFFLNAFDSALKGIRQAHRRFATNMGVLRVDHPDIYDFITAKQREGTIATFNISVGITDKFMYALENGGEFEFVNPRTKKNTDKVSALDIFEKIVENAWKNGEPGLVFLDKMNASEANPVPRLGPIETTNPCITGDSLIATSKGLVRMEKLVENCIAQIYVDNRMPIKIADRLGRINYMQIAESGVSLSTTEASWYSGEREVFKLTTKCGYEITVTADHKIPTNEGFLELKDIIPGRQEILLQSDGIRFRDEVDLPFIPQNDFIGENGRKYHHNFPVKWNKGLGQIIGWLIGDGWLRSGDKNCGVGFTFSDDDVEIMKYLKPIINQIYGREIKEVKRNNNVYHLSYHGKYFVGFFEKLGVKAVKAEDKIIPDSIFTASHDAVIGFLQGLFSADGTVNYDELNGNYYIRLTSKSEKLLKQVQLLLISLGIKTRIYPKHRNKREVFNYKTADGRFKIYESDGKLYELNISRDMINTFVRKIGFLCNKNSNKLDKMKNKNFLKTEFKDVVMSIEPIGTKKVYDLTEPLTHSFIANGLLLLNCGEQPLYPYDSCNLGSIDVSKMITNKNGKMEIDWNKLKDVTRKSIRFLDNVIDASQFPLKETEKTTKSIRRIGLGIMGYADMLIKLNIPYNSEESLRISEQLMKFITEEGRKMSVELGEEKGSFDEFENSIWKERKYKTMRNSTITTIAPTSNLSIISGCSHSIEPLFSITYVRNVVSSLGTNLIETNPLFERIAKERGFYSEKLMQEVLSKGSIHNIKEIPEDVRRVFTTSHDITPEWHIRVQAAFQKYTDNAVSKTINFPHEATMQDIETAYKLAYKLGCKGITVYRDGSRQFQIINTPNSKSKATSNEEVLNGNGVDVAEKLVESTGGCPTCHL